MYETEQELISVLSQPGLLSEGALRQSNIIRHSFYITTQGRRRRYRCKECGRTFSSTHGTPYYRLHKPRSLFDEVVHMCVHGLAISALARIKRMGTVARWLESAATCATRFNDRMLKGFVNELQADEIRTFGGAKKRVIWVLTTFEVWSRLWVSVVVGRRNFRHIKRVLLNTLERGRVKHRFLFTTDGFEMYEWAVKRLLTGVCIYGQAIKKRRENRVVRVNRRLLLGTQAQLEEAVFESEDSSTLNTSFVAWIGAEMEFALSQAVASGDAFEHRPPECGHCVQNFLADLDLRDLSGEAARFELGADHALPTTDLRFYPAALVVPCGHLPGHAAVAADLGNIGSSEIRPHP